MCTRKSLFCLFHLNENQQHESNDVRQLILSFLVQEMMQMVKAVAELILFFLTVPFSLRDPRSPTRD